MEMKEYRVKLIMSEESVIRAETEEAAIKEAKEKFGCDYYIDDVEVTELQETPGIAKRRNR